MTSRISHTSVDSHNAYAQSQFWRAALGYTEHPDEPDAPGDEECLIYSPDRRHLILDLPARLCPPCPDRRVRRVPLSS